MKTMSDFISYEKFCFLSGMFAGAVLTAILSLNFDPEPLSAQYAYPTLAEPMDNHYDFQSVPSSVDTQVEILAHFAFKGVPDEKLKYLIEHSVDKAPLYRPGLYVERGLAQIELYNRHH